MTHEMLADDEVEVLDTFAEAELLRWDANIRRLYFRGAAHDPEALQTNATPFLTFKCPAGYPDSSKIAFDVDCDSYSPESAALMPPVRRALNAWLQEQDSGDQMAFLLACELQEILGRISEEGAPEEEAVAADAGDDFEKFPEKVVKLFFDPGFVDALRQAEFKPGRTDAEGNVWVWSYYSKTAGDIQLTGQAAEDMEYLCSPYDILLEHNALDKSSCAQFFFFRYRDNAHANQVQFAKDIVYWAEEQLNNARDQAEGEAGSGDEEVDEAEESLMKNIVGNIPSIEEVNEYFVSKGIPPITKERLAGRKLSVYSWGSNFYKTFMVPELKGNGVNKDNNVNATILNGSHSGCADNNGTTLKIQRNVACGGNFRSFILMSISKIERRDLSVLGVNCHKGRHRSVAVAILLKEFFYKSAEVKHLTLKRADH